MEGVKEKEYRERDIPREKEIDRKREMVLKER